MDLLASVKIINTKFLSAILKKYITTIPYQS